MKRLRQICAVTVLTILLANAASAEDGVTHPWFAPPPSPVTTETTNPNLTPAGEVDTKGQGSTTDMMTEITLHLIQNMLGLF
jgi:hypothetical protein